MRYPATALVLKKKRRMPSEHYELTSLPDLSRPDPMDQSLTNPLGASNAPLEILQYIFVLAAHSHKDFELRPGVKHPALQFAHVSRAWRAAALGTRILWSRLKVDISSHYFRWGNTEDCSDWRWRPALDLCLELSQNFPLRISLTFRASMLQENGEELHAIVSALLHTAPRWKSLFLVCRSDCDGGDWSFLDPLYGRMDSLEKLIILVLDIAHIGRAPLLSLSRCTAFRDAPKLTKVDIMSNGVLVELPWSRLLRAAFTVNGIGDKASMVHDFLVGLQKADQLKSLGCREFYGDDDIPVLDRPIIVELPRLEEITIFAWSQVGHWLVLPSLSKLRVFESQHKLNDDPVLSPHFIQSLIVRSNCNIISLTISNALGSRTVDGFRAIAHHLPQLVSLRFEQDLWEERHRSNNYRRGPRCDIAMGVFSFLTRPPTAGYSTFSLLQNVSLWTRVEQLCLDDVSSLSVMLASRAQLDSVAARVWTYARVYRTTKDHKCASDRIQGPYDRFSTVEDDPRWQMLTGEYRGQLNVLIEIIGRSTYDYRIWLGRTPEPENFWP